MTVQTKDSRYIANVRFTQGAMTRLALLHADWLAGRPSGKRVMLRECDLSGLDFRRLDLREGIFEDCDFTRINGVGVKFTGAVLRGGKFDRANLRYADFERADLKSVSFEEASLIGALLGRADIRKDVYSASETSFKGAQLTEANFSEAKLKGADFSGAVLERANLTNADLRGVSFRDAEICNAVIAGANMADSDFTGAFVGEDMKGKLDVTRIKDSGVRRIDSEKMEAMFEQHDRWVLSLGKEGERAIFSGFDLSGLDLSGHNLALADFSAANLANTVFSDAWLLAANFRRANMTRSVLKASDLRGADFREARQREIHVQDCRTGELPGIGIRTLGLSLEKIAA